MVTWATQPFRADPRDYNIAAGQNAEAAGKFVNILLETAKKLAPPVITPVFPKGDDAPPISVPEPPLRVSFSWSVPGLPDTFNRTLNIDGYLPAPFDELPPKLVYGTAPKPDYGSVPSAPPVNVDFPFPDLPPLEWPAAPRLLTINTYTFDGITIPEFVGDVSELQIADPQVYQYVPGDGYVSSLLTHVADALNERLNGGTGLPPEVERAIWDRGRDREAAQLAESLAALEQMESLGYSFPPGVYLDANIKLRNEYAAKSYGLSREIMIKQAELEQANIRDALQQSVVLESKLIDAWNQSEQRALDAAKYMTQAAVETYNAKVRAYSAYLEVYRTKAAIYDAKIKGLLAKVDAYKAEMQAEEIKAQVNTALVNQYKTLVDVVASSIEIYKAELSAIQTKAQIEKLKIDIYGEQIKGFVGTVNAYTAQVEGYKAGLGAEQTKVEAYKARVEAYSAEVGAQVKVIDARISEYKAWLEAKQSEYEGFKAAVSAEGAHASATAQIAGANAEVYKAEVSGTSAYNETLTKQWQVALDQAQRVSDIANNAAKMNADLVMQARGISIDATKVGAQVYSQLAAALINAINWSTSYNVSNSGSASDSYSNSYSKSDSYSETKSLSV